MEAIGPYQVLATLGSGATSQVLRARDARNGQLVAVKLLRAGGEHQRGRFRREVEALLRLRHPGIVAFREAGEHRGAPYLVMDLVEGASLQELVEREGPFTSRDAAGIVAAVARALQHAHQRGILHRDIKPANVRLTPRGEPLLVDFGLARDAEVSGSSLSVEGQFLGTPGFWPPEQAQGNRALIGPASDVYALGATLFALLTGRPPFLVSTLQEAARALESAPPRPSSLVPGVDPALEEIVLRCLARDPQDRPSAEAVVTALEAWRTRSSRPERGRGPSPLAAGLAALLLAGGASLAAWRLQRPRPSGEQGAAPPVSAAAPDRPQLPGPANPTPPGPGPPEWTVSAGSRWACYDAADRLLAGGDVTPPVPLFGKPGPWVVDGHALGDLDGDGQREVVLLARHERLFPALVLVLDQAGRLLGQMEHPGQLRCLLLCDQDRDGDDELFAGGLDNQLPASIVVLGLDLEGELRGLGRACLGRGVATDGSAGLSGLTAVGSQELLAWTQAGEVQRVPLPLEGEVEVPVTLRVQATAQGLEVIAPEGRIPAALPAPIRGWIASQVDDDAGLELLVADARGEGLILQGGGVVTPLDTTLPAIQAALAHDLDGDGLQELVLAGPLDPDAWAVVCQDPQGRARWRHEARGPAPTWLKLVGRSLDVITPAGVWRLRLADGLPTRASACLSLELPPGTTDFELGAEGVSGGERREVQPGGPPFLALTPGEWRVRARCDGRTRESALQLQAGQARVIDLR